MKPGDDDNVYGTLCGGDRRDLFKLVLDEWSSSHGSNAFGVGVCDGVGVSDEVAISDAVAMRLRLSRSQQHYADAIVMRNWHGLRGRGEGVGTGSGVGLGGTVGVGLKSCVTTIVIGMDSRQTSGPCCTNFKVCSPSSNPHTFWGMASGRGPMPPVSSVQKTPMRSSLMKTCTPYSSGGKRPSPGLSYGAQPTLRLTQMMPTPAGGTVLSERVTSIILGLLGLPTIGVGVGVGFVLIMTPCGCVMHPLKQRTPRTTITKSCQDCSQ